MAVNDQHPDYVKMAPEWTRLRNVIAGERTMRLNAKDYIRRPTGMVDNNEWEAYVGHVPFFDATSRTVDGLTGMAFAEQPQIKLPDSLSSFRTDTTLSGVSLLAFGERVFNEAIVLNRGGIFVDMPELDPRVRTQRDAERANRRAYAQLYPAEAIFNWETGKIDGVTVLTEVRLTEQVTEKTGLFETTTFEQIRVLMLDQSGDSPAYTVILFRKDRDKKWVEHSRTVPLDAGAPLKRIPFWFFNCQDQTTDMLKPPLLGLANANIAHFNTSARLENALTFAGAPQPYVTGVAPDSKTKLTIGSAKAWFIQDAQAKVDYLSIGSEGVAALESRLKQFEQHMALLGARMLSPDTKGVEAAETAQIHRQGEISVVMSAANAVSTVIEEVLRFMAKWGGVETAEEDIEFEINTRYFESEMTGEQAQAVVGVWQSGAISFTDVLAAFKRGRFVAPDRTEEDIAGENQSGLITPASLGLGGTGMPSGNGRTAP